MGPELYCYSVQYPPTIDHRSSELKTTWDYTELAAAYDRRGDYAPDAIDQLVELAGVSEGDLVADIGAGTGKLTRPLLDRRLKVHAVEPNDAMRAHRKNNRPIAPMAPG